jgi:hypothetical protein
MYENKTLNGWYLITIYNTDTPNLQSRAPDMSLSDNTANSLRNVERDQWQTTYDLQHTGIGPSNPMSLENLNNKMNVYYTYGVDDLLC